MSTYRCAVPMCRSTSIKHPNKLFIHVPRCPKRRRQWIQLARRDPKLTSNKSTIFFCEDHFDLPNDMENFIKYSVMGSVGKIKMKADCLPSKFVCQPDRIKRTASPQPRSAVLKRLRRGIIEEVLSEANEMPATSGMTSNSGPRWSSHVKVCRQPHHSIKTQEMLHARNRYGSGTSPVELLWLYHQFNLSERVVVLAKENSNFQTPHWTMDEETNGIDAVKEEMSSECRTCLQTINSDTELYYIFQSWVPPWEGIDYSIAEALEKLAQVKISAVDQYSKMICGVCCQKLYSACVFTTLIQQSDQALRQRHATGLQTDTDDNWPKPIKINVNIPADDQLGVEVKKEVLSDDEYSEYSRVVEGHADVASMDIKIEPTELIMQQHSNIGINGNCEGSSLGDITPEFPSLNGDDNSQDLFSVRVKEEPVSDNESMESDLSLDCMLCTKVFNSVSGLKAHVIAHHSYKSVRRKADNESSPAKRKKNQYQCGTCRRSFATSTDLMVHETCHKKSVCYGCNEKFDSFELVMQHRLSCKAINNKGQVAVVTLEDVQRLPRPAAQNEDEEDEKPALLKCTLCNEQFTDDYYMNIHLEIHHPAREDAEVDALETMFTERA